MALIRHLPMDDNAASPTLVALVGDNSTITGTNPNTQDRRVAGPGGIAKWGIGFNGIDNTATFSWTNAAGTNSTLSFWGKWDGVDPNTGFFGRTSNLSSRIFYSSDTVLRARFASVDNNFTVPTRDAEWHHYLISRNSSDLLRVFVDGVESSTGGLTSTQLMGISHMAVAQTSFAGVALAQIKLFDSDESDNVASLYAEGIDQASTESDLNLLVNTRLINKLIINNRLIQK